MFGNVWNWAGRYRVTDKNIGEPWHQVSMSVRNLCDDVHYWIELAAESFDGMAVRFHHRLVSIHPFANGNGRHARLMTDLLLQVVLDSPPFTWGSEDLSNPGEARKRYIAALHAADANDYAPLMAFVRT